jgi:two-component system phosphate regulon sensor histidine kinase PhoR
MDGLFAGTAAVIFAVLIAWTATVLVILPLLDLRKSAGRIARGDFRPVILPGMPPFLRGIADDLRVTAETLSRQRELIEEEEFSFSLIMESMTEGVVITAPDLRIRFVNNAAAAMFNLRGSVSGLLLPEVFLGHGLQTLAERAAGTGEVQRGELTQPIPGRSERCHLVVTAAVLKGAEAERPGGVLLVLHDVTRLRELESVRREFVANVSHEFRTPLSIINGYLETLEEGGVGREMLRKSISVMRRHADRLNRLIEDLLTISRMEEKGVRLETASADVAGLLSSVVSRLDPEIRQRGAEVRLDIESGLPSLTIDSYRMEQAFSNLLANALRHGSPAGSTRGVRVTVAMRREGPDLAISFSDDGPGIPFQDQEHLFERFYRVGGDRARQTGGTGLGLSIVKHVVQAHGGRVGLRSRPGEGSTFTIHLPLAAA